MATIEVTDENFQEITGRDGIVIRALPTVAVYPDSIQVFFQAGALPKPVLEGLITQVRALDMEQVRAEHAEHAHEHGHVHS